MRVLGIEGTAWMASAAVHDTERDTISIESEAYEPEQGGIHPREAAEHMSDTIPRVIDTVLGATRDKYGPDAIDAVAFSRGPGLGPCLRIVGTAARTLAGQLEVPLLGVNHMIAHLEIGRHQSGFADPVCLNASGANAHLLAFRSGRYRVLGETMDTGVGNAIDKFARYLGWGHPGGPKVEERARDGSFHDLPYVVKGMDFSFSGLTTAAQEAVDDGVPVADVCFALQEHAFGMLTEVSERALSLVGADELVLGGGVGQNARLREMLEEMCESRDADFYAPEPRFLRDNAGMIAVLGAKMAAADDTLTIPESTVDPGYRPDEVPVTWRDETRSRLPPEGDDPQRVQGAEAIVERRAGEVVKRRIPKSYRHPVLDDRLRRSRTVAEARLLQEARREGVPTPLVRDVDVHEATLRLQHVGDFDLTVALTPARARTVGTHLARLHTAGIVHGDPTTRNVRVKPVDDEADRLFLVDFGLAYHTNHVEDHAMDLHVLSGSFAGVADEPASLMEVATDGYLDAGGDEAVLERLREVENRGRYH